MYSSQSSRSSSHSSSSRGILVGLWLKSRGLWRVHDALIKTSRCIVVADPVCIKIQVSLHIGSAAAWAVGNSAETTLQSPRWSSSCRAAITDAVAIVGDIHELRMVETIQQLLKHRSRLP